MGMSRRQASLPCRTLITRSFFVTAFCSESVPGLARFLEDLHHPASRGTRVELSVYARPGQRQCGSVKHRVTDFRYLVAYLCSVAQTFLGLRVALWV